MNSTQQDVLKTVQTNDQSAIDDLIKTSYQHGFVTDIESDTFPAGLNEDAIRRISSIKK